MKNITCGEDYYSNFESGNYYVKNKSIIVYNQKINLVKMNISKSSAITALSILLKTNIIKAKKLETRASPKNKKDYIEAIKSVVIYTKTERELSKGK